MNQRGSNVDVDRIFAHLPRPGTRTPACLSQALLDRVALGEATAPETEAAQPIWRDVRPVPGCRRALERDRAAFLREANVGALAADALARASMRQESAESSSSYAKAAGHAPWWRRLVPTFAVAAAAGAPCSLLRAPTPPEHPGLADRTATKGSFGLGLFVLHAEASRRAGRRRRRDWPASPGRTAAPR